MFGLYTKEAIGTIPANALLDILTTDKDGKAQSSADLPLCKLYLKELAAPHGGYERISCPRGRSSATTN